MFGLSVRVLTMAIGVVGALACDGARPMSGTGGRPAVDAGHTGGAGGRAGADGSGGTGGPGGASGGAGGGAGGHASGGAGGGMGGRGGCSKPAGCCASDGDCLPTEECVSPTACVSGQVTGVCKAKPTSFTCWRPEDCQFGQCFGAQVCPCGAACLVADRMGSCAMP